MGDVNKPTEHLEEAAKLEAAALVDLFEMKLVTENATVRFKNDDTVVYLGNTYEGMAAELTGEKRSADDEESRPKLRIFNPQGLFSGLVRQRLLDRAVVTRKRVLLKHITANVAIFQQRRWYVSRIPEVISGRSVLMELRGMTEGPTFQIPARTYTPDQGFPFVRLK